MQRLRMLGIVSLILLLVLFAGGSLVNAELHTNRVPEIRPPRDAGMVVNWYEGPSATLPLLQMPNVR